EGGASQRLSNYFVRSALDFHLEGLANPLLREASRSSALLHLLLKSRRLPFPLLRRGFNYPALTKLRRRLHRGFRRPETAVLRSIGLSLELLQLPLEELSCLAKCLFDPRFLQNGPHSVTQADLLL